jgi:D-alanyl-D-alanine carboxypeptidase
MDPHIPEDYGAARGLKRQPEAAELVSIATHAQGREVRLAPAAAAAWRRMRSAAESAGVLLLPVSGFRSVSRQDEIIREKLAAGQPLEAILRVMAAPGYSEHHTGNAIDIAEPGQPPLEESFERTAAFRWLDANAPSYGFHLSYPRGNIHGFVYEPWHWCFK